MTTTAAVLIIAAIVVVAILAWYFIRQERSKKLRSHFGPEYDRALHQYGNQANPLAHYNGTALEILEELDEVAAFVAGLGTGGTLMGNGRRLKEELGDQVKIVAAEPMQGEPVQGLRSLDDGFIPPILDLSLLDRKIVVTNADAIVFTRKLLDEERIFAGVSSGAIARVAIRIASELDEGNVVFIVADDGWKYLSSGIYSSPIDEIANLDATVWW